MIQQAFGTFDQNMIAREVCDQCNARFDRELDVVQLRGTQEGYMRFALGYESPLDYHTAGRRSKMGLVVKDGPSKGMHYDLTPSADGSCLVAVPAPQFALSSVDAAVPDYFRPADMPTLEAARERYGRPLKVAAHGLASVDALRAALAERGFDSAQGTQPFTSLTHEDGSTVLEHKIVIDDHVFRMVAKIAFNYLIALNPDVAQTPRFDELRRFVRDGTLPTFDFKNVHTRPIIADEQGPVRYEGHTIVLRSDRGRGLTRARVSLYSLFTYEILLSTPGTPYAADAEAITSGHFFDTKFRKIRDLNLGTLAFVFSLE